MQKILELSEKHFMTGLALGSHVQQGGLFVTADGVNPFVNNFIGTTDAGLLQTSSAPTDITGVLVDAITSFVLRVVDASTSYVYGYGNLGHVYQIDNSGDNAATDIKTIASSALGSYLYQGKYHYATLTTIGTWDFSTTWTDAAYSGLQSYAYHPMHEFIGSLYICDKDRISKIKGTTLILNVLDFPSDYRALCVNDDSRYLVIGITQNLGSTTVPAKTKVLFWDATASADSWLREWTIPDYGINSITRDESFLYAHCPRGVYRFRIDYPPEKLFSLTTAEATGYGYSQAAITSYGDVHLWGGCRPIICGYGSFIQGAAKVLLKPYSGLSDNPTAILCNNRLGRMLVATATPKLYRYNLLTGGATGLTAQTIYFNLNGKWNIRKVKITFGEKLASGDSLKLTLYSDPSTYLEWVVASYATYGAVQEIVVSGIFSAELLSILFNFYGGNPKVRRIEFFGELATI